MGASSDRDVKHPSQACPTGTRTEVAMRAGSAHSRVEESQRPREGGGGRLGKLHTIRIMIPPFLYEVGSTEGQDAWLFKKGKRDCEQYLPGAAAADQFSGISATRTRNCKQDI